MLVSPGGHLYTRHQGASLYNYSDNSDDLAGVSVMSSWFHVLLYENSDNSDNLTGVSLMSSWFHAPLYENSDNSDDLTGVSLMSSWFHAQLLYSIDRPIDEEVQHANLTILFNP